jgi:hypothetical protein
MCFIGHGVFGILTKAVWVNYFALFGIGKLMAYRLMPVMGTVDILLGLLLLIRPYRFIPAWLVIWGIVTALCRPLCGEPLGEFIERAGNFGAPLCLLVLSGGIKFSFPWLVSVIDPRAEVDEKTWSTLKTLLRITVCLLLAGHGWLNLIQKPGLIHQYSALGFSNPVNVSIIAGIFEFMAVLAVLVKPVRPLLIAFLIWKIGSELFYPHFEILEWIERGGSYGSILALLFCLDPVFKKKSKIIYTHRGMADA